MSGAMAAECGRKSCVSAVDAVSDSVPAPSTGEPYGDRRGVSVPYGPANHRINLGGRRELVHRAIRGDESDAVECDTPAIGPASLRDARVLIVDDSVMYREHLADVISDHGATFTGVAWDVPSLVSAFEDILPRVVLVNVAMRDSAILLRQALSMATTVRVIATGVLEDDESSIVACAEAGVCGYHMRSDSLADLLKLVRRVADGESLCSPQVSAILLRRLTALASEQPSTSKELVLTVREAQILEMLELGLSNRDIAERLHIAVHTVKNHVHSLLGKLGVGSRAQAAALSRSRSLPEGDRRN